MTHLRYLKSQPHLQKEPLGTVPVGAGKFGRVQVPARNGRPTAGVGGSGLSGIQRALSAIGLGGAAHPIRRLEHPGGQMALPWVGGGAVGRLSAFANQAEPATRLGAIATKLNPVRAAQFARMRDPMDAKTLLGDVAQRAFVAQAKVSAAAGLPLGFYETSKLFHMHADPAFSSGKWDPNTPLPPSPHWPTKAQFATQEARDQRVQDALNQDAQWLVRSGQATKQDAQELARWANNVNPQEWRNARNHIADTFKPPRAGWLKAP